MRILLVISAGAWLTLFILCLTTNYVVDKFDMAAAYLAACLLSIAAAMGN